MENSSANLTNTSLSALQEVLNFVHTNKYSDFYRKKYAGHDYAQITSHADFQKIPFLKKSEIIDTDIKERTFVPESQIAYYSFTSGTTARNKPTVIPHASFQRPLGVKDSMDEELLERLKVSTILILQNPLSPGFFKLLKKPLPNVVAVPGDTHNLKLTAQISKELEIDAIKTSPTILYFFITDLKEISFDFASVKYISLGGEYCSSQKAAYFKEVFPNAYLFFRYASSESDVKGYRCDELAKLAPNKFHLNPNILTEIVDEQGAVVPLGVEGEIVNTDLENGAFPLVRYKTGDIGSLTKHACSCGEKLVLNLGGRLGADILRIHGVTINASFVDEALLPAKEYLQPFFEMHVFEEKVSTGIKPKLQLHLCLKKEHQAKSTEPYFVEIISEKISSSLQLSPTNTLKSLVEKGIFFPLEIVFLEKYPESKTKQKPIISHIE